MIKTGVVILNFNVKTEVKECLRSVFSSGYNNLFVCLVNNSKEDFSDVLKDWPSLNFIQTDKNLGYSGGNNLGIKKALAEKCEYVFVLNPDTTIAENTINRLVALCEETGCGIIGPKIYFENSKKIWYAGGILDLKNVLGSHRGVNEIDRGQFDKEVETDYVSGAAFFIKKEVLEKIGYFDEKYFLYYEDSDYCFRAKKAGFKVIYYPQSVVYHANAKSTGLGSNLQNYFITRNRMLFASKFLPLRARVALFREALTHLGDPIRRLALWDFLTGNFGQGSFKI